MVNWSVGDTVHIKLPSAILQEYPQYENFISDEYDGGGVDDITSYNQSVFNNSYGYTTSMLGMALRDVVVVLNEHQVSALNNISALGIDGYTFHVEWLKLATSTNSYLVRNSILANIIIDGE